MKIFVWGRNSFLTASSATAHTLYSYQPRDPLRSKSGSSSRSRSSGLSINEQVSGSSPLVGSLCTCSKNTKAKKPRLRTFAVDRELNHDDLSSVRNCKSLGAEIPRHAERGCPRRFR